MRVVVIGSGTAGSNFALFLRKLDRKAEIIVIGKEPTMQYSPCALPHVISGTIEKPEDVIVFPNEFYEKQKIKMMLGVEAKKIDRERKVVITDKGEVPYDKLVLATGSKAFIPPIKGVENEGVFTLKSLDDVRRIKEYIGKRNPKKAVVIGAGLIGLEGAEAFAKLGMEVLVVELLEHLLPTMLDKDMASIVQKNMEEHGVKFRFGVGVSEIIGNPVEAVKIGDETVEADLVLVATGVRANVDLAKDAGLEVNRGIVVNEYLQTSDPDIYAIGDCAEVIDAVTGKRTLSQLGTSAVRMAKVAAEHIAGKDVKFRPVFNTAITELFDLEIGTFGMTEERAKREGIDVVVGKFRGSTKPEYYPGGKPITVKLIFRKEEGRLIGAQIVGGERVWGRIMTLSALAQMGAKVEDIAYLETAYAPPISPTIDPITVAADMALRKMKR
ncbi:NAD(P)/FAD-dependent oxidoreductase [Pyrococcus abyssi]|uniref:NADH oxidase (NoxA-2) n=1 Tax=Pyrococcus abyssi (strain GE5 / Orsay) TaxID=272844 RepID=Q9V0X9_PYRAB|nr:FAD-dependent oxidoreductase [Pyrococcus abyssi]CAB49573.1 noxA-2 NADH oxidase [Pyrococcus abyssi GE5]CCE70045.1 TPA: NADH oxidase (noxA-2) [Pyrococcus abyssi GE5]